MTFIYYIESIYFKEGQGLINYTNYDYSLINKNNKDNMFNYSNARYMYILDQKHGDVNGDGIPDTIYLTGEKKENPFYENIKITIKDDRTMQRYVIPLCSAYNIAYSPWLFVDKFTGSIADEIMISLPVGGSGAMTFYYIISFFNNSVNYLLSPEQFMALTAKLEFEVLYLNEYKVLIKSKMLNQSKVIDVSDRKDVYEGTIYNIDGSLIKPINGFVINQPHLYPVKFDGSIPYKIEVQQDIAGTSHADLLGYALTYWNYNKHENLWIINPEIFFVVI